MIDKVNNFKQFVNEQYQNENFILWGNLPLSAKNDITENLRDNIKYLQSNYWNSESFFAQGMHEWVSDNYFQSQDSFFSKDGKNYARAVIRRWV